MITQIQLVHLFDYCNGNLVWRKQQGRARAGDIAGCVAKNGYVIMRVNGIAYFAHRLIYLYHFGELPDYIDHINRNPSDNRIENLRACSAAENQQNRSPTRTKNGYTGVFRSKNGKYYSQIVHNRVCHNLGTFDTAEQAFLAYCRAKKQIHTFNPDPTI